MWTHLLRAGLILVLPTSISVTTHLRAPELVSCVFQQRANISCQWKPGDPQMTHYTLRAEKTECLRKERDSKPPEFTCNTSGTNCTVDIGNYSVRSNFSISITAHGRDSNVTSEPRCQSGRIEIKLQSVIIENVMPVAGDPKCLSVFWRKRDIDFAVSKSEIYAGHLQSQMAFKAEGQRDFQQADVTVKDFKFTECWFRPGTNYTLRLRHRYKTARSPWSSWSNTGQGRTAEDAPSSAPLFWRRVNETDQNGWRLTSLLWKPLPPFLANGIVRSYNVTCQTEGGLVLTDNGSCRNLHGSNISCSLPLPPGRCSCSLRASNSAGTSPQAWIWLHGAQDAELPSMSQVTVKRLDDHQLEVRWAAPAVPSPSGFVVEWFAVREKNDGIFHWEHLNRSCTRLVISGVQPLTRYSVSVRALYTEGKAGQESKQLIYTRQEVPSAGPEILQHKISGNTVELSWAPVPVEDRRGFIRSYTINYTTTNQTASETVPGDYTRHILKNLSPGDYNIYLTATTDAGPGKKGTPVNVHIGLEEVSLLKYMVCALTLASGVLILIACLAHSNIMKDKLYQDIPDPSNSSLSLWTLKPALESMKWATTPEKSEIKYSEVVVLNDSELHNSAEDQDFDCKATCHLQMYPSHQLALQLESDYVDTHHQTGADASLVADYSSCPTIYTNIPSFQTLPASLLPPLNRDRHYGSVHIHDGDLHPGSPQSTSRRLSPPQKDTLGTRHHLHGSLSFSSLCGVSHPSPFFSHLAASPQHLFAQNRFSSAQQLEPLNPPETFTPFPRAVFLDCSQSPMECDPYISV